MAIAVSSPRLLRFKPRDRSHIVAGSRSEADPSEQKKAGPSRKGAGGLKKAITGFSKASRINLARKLAQLASPHEAAHVTLTYGHSWPASAPALAAEKTAIQTRLSQLGLFGYWVLEYQKRGAPHWHLLLFGASLQTSLVAARVWWAKRTGNSSVQGMFVTPGEAARASWYFALHSQKEDQSPNFAVGRWWGVVDGPSVKRWSRAEQIAEFICDREIIWLKRLARRHAAAALGARMQAFVAGRGSDPRRVIKRENGRVWRRLVKYRGSMGVQGFSWFLPEIQHTRVLLWAHGAAALNGRGRPF